MKRMIYAFAAMTLSGTLLLTACSTHASGTAETAAAETSSADGSGTAASQSADDISAAEKRMLNDLIQDIYYYEIMYGDVKWALDAFEKFDSERSWSSLQMARASIEIVRRDISVYEFPGTEMTAEDYDMLMRAGIDASFMENRELQFSSEKEMLENICLNLHINIMDDVFLQDDWDISVRYVRGLRELIEYELRYLAYMADWTLAGIDSQDETEQFHQLMRDNCPMTYEYQAEHPGSTESIEADTDRVLDEIERLNLETEKIIGARTDRLNRLQDILEKRDYSSLEEDLMEIKDMPLLLFYPVWYNDENVGYYWRENDEVQILHSGDELERMPDICRIQVSDVTADEVKDYQETLANFGLPCYSYKEEDGKLTIIYKCGDSLFALSWEDDTATILMSENPVCMVPFWYLSALQAADGGF